jgi:uncharacterized membrane protein
MRTKNLVFTSIFIALCFVATMIIKFPISIGWGYVHFGDSIVILAGMLLGPVYGAISAAIGSALADYASGYAHYMLATFLVKGSLAFAIGFAYKNLAGQARDNAGTLRIVYHVVAAIIIVVGGYFITDMLLAKLLIVDAEGSTPYAYAAFGVIPNMIQAAFGAAVSLLLYVPLKKPFDSMFE